MKGHGGLATSRTTAKHNQARIGRGDQLELLRVDERRNVRQVLVGLVDHAKATQTALASP